MRDPRRLGTALEGLAGAPGRRGVVHVVALDPAAPMAGHARALLLVASATVLAGTDIPAPVRRLAGGARHDPHTGPAALAEHATAGEIVVRVVAAPRVEDDDGAVVEIEALAAAAVPYEVVPRPSAEDAPEVLTRWRDHLALVSRTVLVPRAPQQAAGLAMHVRSLGGRPVEAPVILIRPGDTDALDDAVRGLAEGSFAAVCLTSPNGVDALATALGRVGADARALAHADLVAAVGPGTAGRLAQRLGVDADLVPAASTTAGLAEAMPPGEGRVLLPRADIATNALKDGLAATGWEPVEIAAYRTQRPESLPPGVADMIVDGTVDLVPVASSSTVRNLVALLDGRPVAGAVVSIGPVTTATCREHGIEPAVEADPHDLDGLVAALCEAASGPDT